MSAKHEAWSVLVAIGMSLLVACSSIGGMPPPVPKPLVRINVSVETASYDVPQAGVVEAVLIDRYGKRTGWTRDGQLREIRGCGSQSGWGDGIPNPRPNETDTAAVRAWERTQANDESEPLPTWHFFEIGADVNDLAGGRKSLLDQGGCALRLNPVTACEVRVALNANGIGIHGCQDTASTFVTPGKAINWRLSWKVVRGSCDVEISPLEERAPLKPPAR